MKYSFEILKQFWFSVWCEYACVCLWICVCILFIFARPNKMESRERKKEDKMNIAHVSCYLLVFDKSWHDNRVAIINSFRNSDGRKEGQTKIEVDLHIWVWACVWVCMCVRMQAGMTKFMAKYAYKMFKSIVLPGIKIKRLF